MSIINRAKFCGAITRNFSEFAVIAACGASITFGLVATSRADAPAAPQPVPSASIIHRMMMTPTWSTKSGSSPVVSGITVHTVSRHVVGEQDKIGAKTQFNELILIPIWPVAPPAPDPTDPGDGSGSGG